MATYLAQGIIVIRGMNLLSGPVQAAARDTQGAFDKLGRSIQTRGVAINKIETGISKLENQNQVYANQIAQSASNTTTKVQALQTKNRNLAALAAQNIKSVALSTQQYVENTSQKISKLERANVLDFQRHVNSNNVAEQRAMVDRVRMRDQDIALAKRSINQRAYEEETAVKKIQQTTTAKQNANKATMAHAINLDAEKKALLGNSIAENNAQISIKNRALATQQAARLIEIDSQALLQNKLRVDNLRASLGGLAQTLSSVGLMMSAMVTLPIVGAGIAISKTAVDFDKSMRNIQSIGKQTDTQIKELSDGFRKMSTDLKQTVASPKELAESFYEIQSAAFYGADAQTILNASTKAATAGLADQRQTAQAVAMALHAYGKSASEAAHFTDVMMSAVDIGMFRFEDLTTQMGEFIATAGMLDIPFEQVMAALTTMTKKGIPIAESATSLNRIMLAYLKPAKAEEELAKSLGITLSANTLTTLGLANAMDQLITATKGNEDTLVDLIGEARAIRGVFALASDGLQMFTGDLTKLGNATGRVGEVYNVQIRAWDMQLKNFKNTVDDLSIAFGEVLLPELIKFANVNIRPLIDNLRALPSDKIQEILHNLMALAAAGPVLIGLSVATNTLNASLAVFNVLSKVAVITGLALSSVAGLAIVFAGFGVAIYNLALGIDSLTTRIDISRTADLQLEGARQRLTKATQDVTTAQQNYSTALATGNKEAITAAALALDEATAFEFIARQKTARARTTVGTKDMEAAMAKYQEALRTGNGVLEQAAIKEIAAAKAQIDLANATLISGGAQSELAKFLGITNDQLQKQLDLLKGIQKVPVKRTQELYKAIITTGGEHIGLTEGAWPAAELPTPLPGSARALELQRIDDLRKAMEDAASDSQKAWEDAFQEASSKIKGYLTEGVNVSKALKDLTPHGTFGGGPLAAGAGGPFEDIYRLQAWLQDNSWAEVAKKYGITSKAMGAQIIKDFQMGLMTPEVERMINTGQMIDMARMEAAAEASQKRLAEKLSGASGLGADVFNAMFGLGKTQAGVTTVPPLNLAAVQTGISEQAKTLTPDISLATVLMGLDSKTLEMATNNATRNLLSAFDNSLVAYDSAIRDSGKRYWNIFEGGLVNAAKASPSMYNAIYSMVTNILQAEYAR